MKRKIIKFGLIALVIAIAIFAIWKITIAKRLAKAKADARAIGIVVDKKDALKFLKKIGIPKNTSTQTKKLLQKLKILRNSNLYPKYISQQELNDAKLPYTIKWEWKQNPSKQQKINDLIISKNLLTKIEVHPFFEGINDSFALETEDIDQTAEVSIVISDFKYQKKQYNTIYLNENNKVYQLKKASIIPLHPQNKKEIGKLNLLVKYLDDDDFFVINNFSIDEYDLFSHLNKVQLLILAKQEKSNKQLLTQVAELIEKQKSPYLIDVKGMLETVPKVDFFLPIKPYTLTTGNLAVYFAETGNKERCFKYLLRQKQAVLKTCNEPILISSLIKARIFELYMHSIKSSLARLSLSAEQLQQLRINNQDLNIIDLAQNSLKIELYGMSVAITDNDIIDSSTKTENKAALKLILYLTCITDLFDINMTNFYRDLIYQNKTYREIAKNPPITKPNETSIKQKNITTIIARELCISLANSAYKTLECLARQNGLNCGIAVERYRLKHGDFPKELQELVPEFIAEIPQDPFGKDKLKYLINDKEVIIYSIGINQIDEQGINNRPTQKDDISFRLLKTKLNQIGE